MTTEAAPEAPKPSQAYEAGCHCGYIKFSVTLSPPLPEYKPKNCDCSACRRFGYLLVCMYNKAKPLRGLLPPSPRQLLSPPPPSSPPKEEPGEGEGVMTR